MPKMSHVIEGWPRQSGLTPPVSQTLVPPPPPVAMPDGPGLWKYQSLRRSGGVVALSIFASVGLHALVLLGFNHRAPPPPPVVVDDGPLVQMVMPDLSDEEEKPVEALSDEETMEAPAVVVPMLVDIPTVVPVDAFVQPLDLTPALNVNPDSMRLSAIPVNIARGSASMAKLGDIFDISQLDRQPQSIIQPPPIFPTAMKSIYPEAQVTLEFIINTKGEVLLPRVIRGLNRHFEDAAMQGVLKWKFRPGARGGRPVNTRTQVTIMFRVSPDD